MRKKNPSFNLAQNKLPEINCGRKERKKKNFPSNYVRVLFPHLDSKRQPYNLISKIGRLAGQDSRRRRAGPLNTTRIGPGTILRSVPLGTSAVQQPDTW